MRNILLFVWLLPILALAQEPKVEQDTLPYEYIFIKGDSIPKILIDLDPVVLLPKLSFKDRKEYRKYLVLKRKTKKVYPYAKLASERLQTMYERLETIEKKRLKRIYTKRMQKYIEGEFSAELKKLTRTEGRILIKLIHRQTGKTTFELIKELRNGWKAFWYNNTATLFDLSLKSKFQPDIVKEDYLIEDILQRSFQNNELEEQDDALNLDFFKLTEFWKHKKDSLNKTTNARTN